MPIELHRSAADIGSAISGTSSQLSAKLARCAVYGNNVDAYDDLRISHCSHLSDWTGNVDRAKLPAPSTGLVLTHFIVVRDTARSRDFYVRLLEGEVVLEENPVIVKAANSWIIMNPGGPPTPDKPETTLDVPDPNHPVSSFLNVRVADLQATRERLRSVGIEFIAEPFDRTAELRAYVIDPDGHLIEFGEATGLLDGLLADS